MSLKFLLLLFLCVLSPLFVTNSFAQNGEQETGNLAWFGGLNYSYMGRATHGFNIIYPDNEFEYLQRQRFRLQAEVGINYDLNHTFFVLGGLSYLNNGHQSRRVAVVGHKKSIINYDAHFLSPSLGVGIQKTVFGKKMNFMISNGWAYNFYLGESSREPEFDQVDNLNWKNYLSTTLAFGLGYPINSKTNLAFGPKFEINVTETTKQENPWDASNMDFLRIGFQLSLIIKR